MGECVGSPVKGSPSLGVGSLIVETQVTVSCFFFSFAGSARSNDVTFLFFCPVSPVLLNSTDT